MSEEQEQENPAIFLKKLRDELDNAINKEIDDELLTDLIRRTIVRIDRLISQFSMESENTDD